MAVSTVTTTPDSRPVSASPAEMSSSLINYLGPLVCPTDWSKRPLVGTHGNEQPTAPSQLSSAHFVDGCPLEKVKGTALRSLRRAPRGHYRVPHSCRTDPRIVPRSGLRRVFGTEKRDGSPTQVLVEGTDTNRKRRGCCPWDGPARLTFLGSLIHGRAIGASNARLARRWVSSPHQRMSKPAVSRADTAVESVLRPSARRRPALCLPLQLQTTHVYRSIGYAIFPLAEQPD